MRSTRSSTAPAAWFGRARWRSPASATAPVVDRDPAEGHAQEKGPGIYLAAAERSDLMQDEFTSPATNWVLVSDLGLAAYTGADGMDVDVRSLADGKPMPGVTLRLYARNNGELATATSDAEGIARFPGGMLRGRGGDEPFVVTAYGPDDDFNFLEIGRAAFDLSDRGVSGRPQPGPVDAFLYTDRGIYRPGETVSSCRWCATTRPMRWPACPLSCACCGPTGSRSRRGADRRTGWAVIRGFRPGKRRPHRDLAGRVEARSEVAADRLRRIPRRGFCPAAAQSGAAARPTGRSARARLSRSMSTRAYYYGAPGAGLAIEAEAAIALDDNPFPDLSRLQFGLVGEEFTGDPRDIEAPRQTTTARRASVDLADLPD